MQKDGTYSVVPRIAGGEITPDKLIVLGEVAKEFDLYTKITGGQRVDLFGAQVHALPIIWKKLIDAGLKQDMPTVNRYTRLSLAWVILGVVLA
jgi:nitrite reductase (NADH) large subunit